MKAQQKVLNSGKTEPPAAIEPESPEAHPRSRNPCSTDQGSRERTIYRYPAVLTFFFPQLSVLAADAKGQQPTTPTLPSLLGLRSDCKASFVLPRPPFKDASCIHVSLWEWLRPSAPPGIGGGGIPGQPPPSARAS